MTDCICDRYSHDGPQQHCPVHGETEAETIARAIAETPDVSADVVERLCEAMHDAYEAAAVVEGWETQARSRKPWSDVPEANKATMRAAVRGGLVARLRAHPEDAAAVLGGEVERELEDIDDDGHRLPMTVRVIGPLVEVPTSEENA